METTLHYGRIEQNGRFAIVTVESGKSCVGILFSNNPTVLQDYNDWKHAAMLGHTGERIREEVLHGSLELIAKAMERRRQLSDIDLMARMTLDEKNTDELRAEAAGVIQELLGHGEVTDAELSDFPINPAVLAAIDLKPVQERCKASPRAFELIERLVALKCTPP